MTRPLTLHGLALMFANVLVTQLGLPIPALPAMIAAGALGAGEEFSVAASLALAVTAAVIADSIWYVAGWMYGDRVLEFLGRVSSQQLTLTHLTPSLRHDEEETRAISLVAFDMAYSAIP